MDFPNGWSKYKEIEIPGSTSGELNDYQMEDLIIPWESDIKTDFGDIRFVDSDFETELSYHLLSKTDSDQAIFKVKIPNIPESPETKTIYIFFGNPTATTTSNPEDTHDFFDDFINLDNWTVVNGSPACFDSNLELTQGNTIKKTATDDKPLKLIAKVKITGVVSGVYWISPLNFAINSNKDYGAKFISRNGSDEILTYTDGLLNEDAVANYSDNQYHIFEIEIKNSAYVKFKVDCEDVGNYTNYYDSRIDTLWLENYHAGGVSGQDVYIDWIAVDKHIADPPMWGELGETQDIPQIVEVPINAEIPDQYSVPISVCIRYLSYMVPVSVDIPEYIDCKAPILVEVNNKFVSPLTYGVPVSVEITEDIITYNVPINLNIGAEYTFMIPVKGKILYRHYTRPNLPDKDETVSMSVGGVVFE